MGRIPDSFIDSLAANTDLVELIGARLTLKRAGNEFHALCPFHDERSPSFTISPTKQFYHCFGCGAHGGAIRFLMEYDRLEFLDAVEELARRAGIAVPRETSERHSEPDRDALSTLVERTAAFYREALQQHAPARQYLAGRGLGDETIERFGIGYAPAGWDTTEKAVVRSAEDRALYLRAGLASTRDDGGHYDKFRDRVMWPIIGRRGRPIGFGGRVLDPAGKPKYLNSPETELFHKGQELYALNVAKQLRPAPDRLVVVEGYMDVVVLAEHGIDGAVATLGTATTGDHAELLFRHCHNAVFCFDGDPAGRAAAWRAVQSVLPRMRDGRQAFFAFLPDGEDPDSLVRAEGKAGLTERLDAATPLSQFYFDERSRDLSLASLTGRSALADRVREDIAVMPDGSFRDLMRHRLQELTGTAAAPAARHRRGRQAQVVTREASRSLVEQAIARLLIMPSLAAEVADPPRFAALDEADIGLLASLVSRARAAPTMPAQLLIERFDAAQQAKLLALAVASPPGDEALIRTEFLEAIERLGMRVAQHRRTALNAKLRAEGLDPAEKDELRALLAARGADTSTQS